MSDAKFQEQVFNAVDELVADGTFVMKADGTFDVANPEQILEGLDESTLR